MLKTLQKEIAKLETIHKKLLKTIEKSPEGNLRCSSCKGHYQYYSDKTYLGENKKHLRQQLAKRDYYIKLNNAVEKYIKKLKELHVLYETLPLDDIYRKLHPARKQLVTAIIQPIEDQIRDFENITYKKKEFSETDDTAYYTDKNERVRSKSEKIIADTLHRCGIPYHYELPLTLLDRGKQVEIHPDFTVMNIRTGKIYYLEHLGMMDKFSYTESTMRRLNLFERNHILLGQKLLIIHETAFAPLSVRTLQEYIDTYLI